MAIKTENKVNRSGEIKPVYEFHIAAELRRKYAVSDELFSISGNVIFTNISQIRKFVNQINKNKININKIKVSEVSASGLIDEIFHYVIRRYEDEINPKVFSRAVEYLGNKIGEDNFRKILFEFIELFPPVEVFKGKVTPFDYLQSYTAGKSNKEILLEEMLLLYIANRNPANKNIRELFDENYFSNKELFHKVIKTFNSFLQDETSIGIEKLDLFEYLMMPISNKPNSLEKQLEYIITKWDVKLKEKFLSKVLSNKDLSKEEITFEIGGDSNSAPTIVPKYKGNYDEVDNFTLGKSRFNYAENINLEYDEPEQFTSDVGWMPNVILMAKNIYVWLDQLAKKYGKEIKRLDQIPDDELDELARNNINGLWLIGLWERSAASKKIKHIMGNTDAVASAYSLYDYQIANDIGGEESYNNLNERAKSRGIRLASDMVPNHTGIDSDWVRNHPDYFVQVSEPPFNYSFNGEDLSDDPNIEIKIEDGYWEKRDAAVVFRRIDKRYNDIRYIYHGNDGTNMPWNDTAQLDMIKAEVREAVIQKIFDVARKFSIIRFDAAMTLAKKHFSRLWYPQPGMGGDIPSRTDHSMTRSEFDEMFPVEFWREVVDRINAEMPQTLLLAEAFWLMEGYFVRTLGMHRVYNSAFMHMMMKEENGKYRELIYNTLEFEPEILKRYVNFMSNPDEETAIKQFGTDDKYFGVLTLMITLPGLPMFAHGQIEGYTEKYGMEYKRAYYDEQPKDWLVDRHRREIFPLTRKRYLFAEVENFWFYDFYDLNGNLNDNVFVYSNNADGEKTLVIYNNKYDRAYGNFQKSTPKLIKLDNNTKYIKEVNISEALGINGAEGYFYIFRDMVTNLEYLFSGADLRQYGFYFELNGFERRVFGDIKEVFDTYKEYSNLHKKLGGKGVYSLEESLKDEKYAPIYDAFRSLLDDEVVSLLRKIIKNKTEGQYNSVELDELFLEKNERLIYAISRVLEINISSKKINSAVSDKIELLGNILRISYSEKNTSCKFKNYFILGKEKKGEINLKTVIAWIILSEIKRQFMEKNELEIIINSIIQKSFYSVLGSVGNGFDGVALLQMLLDDFGKYGNKIKEEEIDINGKEDIVEYLLTSRNKFVNRIFEDDYVHKYLEVNIYKNVRYFNKERFEEFTKWLLNIFMIERLAKEDKPEKILNLYCKVYEYLLEVSKESGYKLDELEEIIIHKNIAE